MLPANTEGIAFFVPAIARNSFTRLLFPWPRQRGPNVVSFALGERVRDGEPVCGEDGDGKEVRRAA